jgi:hypothetical protein
LYSGGAPKMWSKMKISSYPVAAIITTLLCIALLHSQPCNAKCPFASLGLRERRSLQSYEDVDSQMVINERRALLGFDLSAVETLAATNWQSVKVRQQQGKADKAVKAIKSSSQQKASILQDVLLMVFQTNSRARLFGSCGLLYIL